jgi:hypothetical protein
MFTAPLVEKARAGSKRNQGGQKCIAYFVHEQIGRDFLNGTSPWGKDRRVLWSRICFVEIHSDVKGLDHIGWLAIRVR